MPPAAELAEAVARRSYGKLVAFLAARTGDVAAAEDALADAFAAALVDWPVSGIPRNPEAWLTAVGRRRLIDAARRRRTRGEAADHLRLLAEELDQSMDDAGIPDERLALMFACAHPAIDPTVRSPLMMQTILGFDAAAIGSAFLVAPAAMGQRLVRAKAKIRQAGIRSVRRCRSGWMPCWPRSTPHSPVAGSMRRVATWPRKRSGSAASSCRCCRTSPRRWACSR
jgi:RNA polymerase sigma-70 factor (ECF subfamily)